MNLALLTGPQDPSQFNATINQLIEDINDALSGISNQTLKIVDVLTSLTPGNVYTMYGVATLMAGTTTSGSVAGVRGEANMPSGTTIGGGLFFFGARGKFIGGGTMNHADCRVAGMFAQLDISAGTYTTGQLSGLWVDMGATASASAVSTQGGGQCNILRLQNTTAMKCNAGIYLYTDADYAFDLGSPGGSADYYDITGTVVDDDGWIKVLINGSVRYIGLGATVA